MPSNNNSQYNRLKIDVLEMHALKWAQYYNSDELIDEDSKKKIDDIVRIQRIVLYKSGLGVSHNIKYVLVFEAPQIKKEYKEILSDLQKSLQKIIECDGGPQFLDESFFDDVYIEQYRNDPIKEWLFRYISSDEELQIPEIIPESMKVLYGKRIVTDPNTATKLRPNQRHKSECRKVAAELWEKYPKMTIADMIMRNEIAEACEEKTYAENTLRDWIKDLCPDRSPGRRRQT